MILYVIPSALFHKPPLSSSHFVSFDCPHSEKVTCAVCLCCPDIFSTLFVWYQPYFIAKRITPHSLCVYLQLYLRCVDGFAKTSTILYVYTKHTCAHTTQTALFALGFLWFIFWFIVSYCSTRAVIYLNVISLMFCSGFNND